MATKVKDTTKPVITKEQKDMSVLPVKENNSPLDAESQRKLKRRESDASRKEALKTLFEFKSNQLFKTLPPDIQKAIERIAAAPSQRGTGLPTTVAVLGVMFPKVNTVVPELDVFMKTKKGRSEFRRYVRNALIKAAPEARMWISFNADKETWTLEDVGEKAPEGFNGVLLPESA